MADTQTGFECRSPGGLCQLRYLDTQSSVATFERTFQVVMRIVISSSTDCPRPLPPRGAICCGVGGKKELPKRTAIYIVAWQGLVSRDQAQDIASKAAVRKIRGHCLGQ